MADLMGLVEQAVAGMGYELVDFETSPRVRLLRIFIDRLPGSAPTAQAEQTQQAEQTVQTPGQSGQSEQHGITVDDCVAVSHHLTRLLTVENIDYDRLEVSSPGMDRPIKKLADYDRFAGCEVHLKLRIPEEAGQGGSSPQRNFSGVILGTAAQQVRLQVAGAERTFDFDNIDKARLVPKF